MPSNVILRRMINVSQPKVTSHKITGGKKDGCKADYEVSQKRSN